jgi:hypothetical protein
MCMTKWLWFFLRILACTVWLLDPVWALEKTPSQDRSLWNPLTWKWTPTDEEIQKYRRSWNPMSNGPILSTGVDIQPKGQFLAQPFVFGQFGHKEYGNQLTTDSRESQVHLQAINPTVIFAYGVTDHLELNVIPGTSWVWFQSTKNANSPQQTRETEFSIGDTTIYLKNRPIVQDPDTWRPSITLFHQIVLPSSQWFATKGIPGGFSPLGRLPATRFGALSFTEGVLFRKNIKPFRFSGGVYYTYSAPGHTAGTNTYPGDVINTRFIIEHMLGDKRGFGYNLEFVSLHGLPGRLDGHDLNINPKSFSLFGIEPAIQYKLFQTERGAIVGAAGVLFSIAGQNNLDAIYPNLSIFYYWGNGKVTMR